MKVLLKAILCDYFTRVVYTYVIVLLELVTPLLECDVFNEVMQNQIQVAIRTLQLFKNSAYARFQLLLCLKLFQNS